MFSDFTCWVRADAVHVVPKASNAAQQNKQICYWTCLSLPKWFRWPTVGPVCFRQHQRVVQQCGSAPWPICVTPCWNFHSHRLVWPFAKRRSCYVVMLLACWCDWWLFVHINSLKITVNNSDAIHITMVCFKLGHKTKQCDHKWNITLHKEM